MSYLNALRLHFAGQFQANVSTVNNDPGHFDNAAFRSNYQQMQGALPNGWFNPQGDASFRLLGCKVTSAWTPAGAVTVFDPVLACNVADADGQVPGKLVDLDPEQQLVSEIWGLRVRIADRDGVTLMSGSYTPAAFIDIWDRATGPGAGTDTGAGAAYQSVLTDLVWGDVSASPFLTALQAASVVTGMLSIKFNVDGLNMSFASPDFMCGRLVGTIGPYLAGEPLHMVLGRQFMATAGQGNFFTPTGGINFFPAWVDADGGQIYLDLGNALSTATPGGPNNDLGDLVLGIYDPIATPSAPAGTVVSLGVVRSQGPVGYASYPQWYARTAGVVALPLSPGQLAAVQTRPLVLGDPATAGIAEWSNGLFARADTYVYRMSPGDQAEVTVYATQYGQPLANTSIGFTFDHQQLQPGGGYPYIGDGPSVATPDGVLTFDAAASTGPDGKAVLTVTAGDPGTPRWFNGGADYGIDGQVYGVRPGFADPSLTSGPVNQWNFVSFLAWSGYTPPSTVTWTDLQPIFQQYANLYPVMLRFLNLGDYESVKAHAGLLTLAFGLDIGDPNTMPVTRDLSPAKRQAILGWLSNPIYGEVAPPALRAALPPGADSPPDPAGGPPTAMRGGKAAAAARRLILQTR